MCMNKVNGKTSVYGIIGNPVEKSFSPVMQNTIAEELGISSIYVPFKVEKGEVKRAVDGAQSLGIKGFNVTIPHKKEVLEALYQVDAVAGRIGAVNTLKLTENGYVGYNTDIIGLKKCFEERKVCVKDKVIVLAGAGGASNAAAFFAAEEGAKELIIVNRTIDNAIDLSDRIKKYYDIDVKVISYDELESIENPEIFIQTTSVGMGSNQTPVEDKSFFENLRFVVDIIYTPWETRLMKDAASMGVEVANGFDMLFYQGLAAFEIWNDIKVDEKTAVELKNKLAAFYCNRG